MGCRRPFSVLQSKKSGIEVIERRKEMSKRKIIISTVVGFCVVCACIFIIVAAQSKELPSEEEMIVFNGSNEGGKGEGDLLSPQESEEKYEYLLPANYEDFHVYAYLKRYTCEDDSQSILDLPKYTNYKFYYDKDGAFFMGRDSALYDNTNACQNSLAGMLFRCPTRSIRKTKDNTLYIAYDIDAGYRLFLFSNDYNNYFTLDGFPILIKEMLSFKSFSSLKIGDSIEKVEEIDWITTVYKNELLRDDAGMTPTASENLAKMGYPITSIHYLLDGILKIEYIMLENLDIVITDIEFSEDYTLVGVTGRKTNYKINELDLP